MSRPDEAASERFGAAYWEDRYRGGEGARRQDPSPSLVVEVGALAPGRALDAGCGRGADTLWLAAHGWQVTAVDVSATAVDAGRESARVAGDVPAERIAWLAADLTSWEPGRTFDLVTSHYVHVPGPPEALFRRLASWVAPGGTLLVVGHDDGHDAEHDHGGHGHGGDHGGPAHPPEARVRPGQVVAVLPGDEWDVVVAEPRTHTLQRPDGNGPVTLHDVVVHARRRAPAQP